MARNWWHKTRTKIVSCKCYKLWKKEVSEKALLMCTFSDQHLCSVCACLSLFRLWAENWFLLKVSDHLILPTREEVRLSGTHRQTSHRAYMTCQWQLQRARCQVPDLFNQTASQGKNQKGMMESNLGSNLSPSWKQHEKSNNQNDYTSEKNISFFVNALCQSIVTGWEKRKKKMAL